MMLKNMRYQECVLQGKQYEILILANIYIISSAFIRMDDLQQKVAFDLFSFIVQSCMTMLVIIIWKLWELRQRIDRNVTRREIISCFFYNVMTHFVLSFCFLVQLYILNMITWESFLFHINGSFIKNICIFIERFEKQSSIISYLYLYRTNVVSKTDI